MRSIKNYVQAVKARREENADDKGFSLIELIVVVVILGILAAVAIPIFLNIQDQAKQSAADTTAANAATQAAAGLAQDEDPAATGYFNNFPDATSVTVSYGDATKKIDTFCVVAVMTADAGGKTGYSGPGVKADGTCP